MYLPDMPEFEAPRKAGLNQVKKVVEEYYANGLHTIGI